MSKSCCDHSHSAAIKTVSKNTIGQHEPHHDSPCCAGNTTCGSAPYLAPPLAHHLANDALAQSEDNPPPLASRHDQHCGCTAATHQHLAPSADLLVDPLVDSLVDPQVNAPTDILTEPVTAQALPTHRHSWHVVGMDCPSCARKVETAVSRVAGVVQARVLFATEKLVVDLAPGLCPDLVTAAV
ncbi:MAG: cation transporter, partial [Aeromonas sp.]